MGFGCDIYAYASADGFVIHVAGKRHGKPLELPYAGRAFIEDTLEDFEARLIELRALGYVFPDYVFDAISDERKSDDGESCAADDE